ncbi:hypothetical protein [uncultured Eudoraea sp.]|uniref:hypothetical protein n=1 Tax=uncultured Eudoraea sp. TaxID=1035614 RepID=UPI002608D7A2|nr:hypothetical protein [uncultured Eudoraea sp.]
MSKAGVYKYAQVFSFLLLIFLIEGCTSSQTNFKREYRKIWKETIKSEAWLRSLQKDELLASNDAKEFYSSTEDSGVLEGDSYLETGKLASFEEKYASLISRAYFKIIAEAEEADSRIEQDYLRLSSQKAALENRNNKDYKKNLELARKRYIAHREILNGLKSWNAFNEYGSDDLEFFKEEQADAAYSMFLNGESDENIIDFLIYKLADLYQYEE